MENFHKLQVINCSAHKSLNMGLILALGVLPWETSIVLSKQLETKENH